MSQSTNAIIEEVSARIFAIRRHRINIDGPGIRTLVCFYGCPLNCKYCINPQCKDISKSTSWTPTIIYEQVKIDHLYFKDTGGGITFGGGEPGLYYSFIHQFRKLCPTSWSIAIETSLNYSSNILTSLIDIIDYFIVDIKDISSSIYYQYTLNDNKKVITNLKTIANKGLQHKCLIRIPKIPNYNTEKDIEESVKFLQNLGFINIELFEYSIDKVEIDNSLGKKQCDFLKNTRLNIARENNIDYTPVRCTHIGECRGWCIQCENELKELTFKEDKKSRMNSNRCDLSLDFEAGIFNFKYR